MKLRATIGACNTLPGVEADMIVAFKDLIALLVALKRILDSNMDMEGWIRCKQMRLV